MAFTDIQAERYLSALAEMEQSWQSAVDKALTVREDQLSTAKQVIVFMKGQVQQLGSLLVARNKDVEGLRRSLADLNMKLDSTPEDMALLLESTQKQLEDKQSEHKKELEAKNQEINDLRTRHKQSIQDLAKGARDELQELESQLEAAKSTEEEYKKQLLKAQEVQKEQGERLRNWDRVSEKMCHELDDVKGKLKSSKFANGKLREEMALWKKYAEKVEEERKVIRRDIELEKKVLNKFNQVDAFLRLERQHRNLILDTMNKFGVNLIKDLKQQEKVMQSKVIVMTAETQTEITIELDEKSEIINVLEQKVLYLEGELKKTENNLQTTSEQNTTLREVVLAMKKERERWEREREQVDEEARVSKLEESVRLIKSNLINDQKDICVWSALQDVKKELSCLKNKKVHNAVVVHPSNSSSAVDGRQIIKTFKGKPIS